MSNRTLIEINHDFSHAIKAAPEAFIERLTRYLASASSESADALRTFGVTVYGMRHHSDPFKIEWGGIKIAED